MIVSLAMTLINCLLHESGNRIGMNPYWEHLFPMGLFYQNINGFCQGLISFQPELVLMDQWRVQDFPDLKGLVTILFIIILIIFFSKLRENEKKIGSANVNLRTLCSNPATVVKEY